MGNESLNRKISEEDLIKIKKLYENNNTLTDIAETFDVTIDAIRYWLQKMGLYTTNVRDRIKLKKSEMDNMVKMYKEGKTGREIADKLDLGKKTVYDYLHERGVELRGTPVSDEEAALMRDMYSKGKTGTEIAEKLGRSTTAIYSHITEDFDWWGNSSYSFEKKKKVVLSMISDGIPLPIASRRYGVSRHTILRWLRDEKLVDKIIRDLEIEEEIDLDGKKDLFKWLEK